MRWRGSDLESLLFDRSRWTDSQAIKWAKAHGFRSDTALITGDKIRLRQSEPSAGQAQRTITLSEPLEIQAVLVSSNPGHTDGTLIRTAERAGQVARLYLVGESVDGFYRFRLYLGDDEVLSILWPDSDGSEVWEHIADPWLLYWELHT